MNILIVDAQSIQNTDSADLKGYNAGKKVSGIKRHIAVDSQGFSHAVIVITAEVTDRTVALQVTDRCTYNLGQIKSVLTNGGFTEKLLSQAIQETLG